MSENTLKGIELYLAFEKRFFKKVYMGDELLKQLDRLFLKFSYFEIDAMCSKESLSRYECWSRFMLVINCIQPVFYHYVKEKEFFGQWDNCIKEWIKPN